MKKRILAAIIALIMAAAIMPVTLAETAPDALAETAPDALSEITPYWTVPEGYNVHDYNKAVAFLEQADENGIKNGTKIAEPYNLVYDPEDPDTWGWWLWAQPDGSEIPGPMFDWIEADDGELHLFRIAFNGLSYDEGYGCVGTVDFSWCTNLLSLGMYHENITEIKVQGCSALMYLIANKCFLLREFNATGCHFLNYVDFRETAITSSSIETISSAEYITVLRYSYTNASSFPSINFPVLSELDVSHLPDLTSLDISNCPALNYLKCNSCNLMDLTLPQDQTNLVELAANNNHLTKLDIDNCPQLGTLYVENNELTGIDLSQCPNLVHLSIKGNKFSELDVSACPALIQLNCAYNPLTELDLSNNPGLPFDRIAAVGGGTFSYFAEYVPDFDTGGMVQRAFVGAHCNEDTEFLGWYNEAGELLSTVQEDFDCAYLIDSETVLIARFSGGEAIPGDVNGDGAVTAEDAILALRCAMHLIELTDEQLSVGDVDGNGTLNITDAIIILRTAMGLIG